jgi:nicotinate-nucleotide adenylyltransferase
VRVGVLGGTFDPVHLGHLAIAEEVRIKLDLDRVIFIPAGQPRLRADEYLTPAIDRLRMVELATGDNPYFQVCDIEIQRSGPTYTVDTLVELGQRLGLDTSLYFIVGADILGQFHRWKDPEKVLEACHLVVVSRLGHQDDDWPEWFRGADSVKDKATQLEIPMVDISGTEIRRRASLGESVRYLVPDLVAEYIQDRKLYA